MDDKVLTTVRYIFDPNAWRLQEKTSEGKMLQCTVEGMERGEVPDELIRVAKMAGRSIGNGLYGVDLKESDEKYYVIEVNDAPNLDDGLENMKAPDLFKNIIKYLADEPFNDFMVVANV